MPGAPDARGGTDSASIGFKGQGKGRSGATEPARRGWWRARGDTPAPVGATSTFVSLALRRSGAAAPGRKRLGEEASGRGRVIGVPLTADRSGLAEAADRKREARAAKTRELRAARRAGYFEARPPPPSGPTVHRRGAVRSPGLVFRVGGALSGPCVFFPCELLCECACHVSLPRSVWLCVWPRGPFERET